MEYHDKVLKCADCGAEFIFTAGEQMFFADKGFKNEPKRCKACKGTRAQGNGNGSGSVSSQRVETKTVCSQCGKETTVPIQADSRPSRILPRVLSAAKIGRFGSRYGVALRRESPCTSLSAPPPWEMPDKRGILCKAVQCFSRAPFSPVLRSKQKFIVLSPSNCRNTPRLTTDFAKPKINFDTIRSETHGRKNCSRTSAQAPALA